MRKIRLGDFLRVLGVHLLVAFLLLVVGCGILGEKNITDNEAMRLLFIREARTALEAEGVDMTEKDLAVIYDASMEIAKSPAAALISEKIEGNATAKAKLEELVDKYTPKR